MIEPESSSLDNIVVRGAALDSNEIRVTIRGIPHRVSAVEKIFKELAENHIVIDMIVQTTSLSGQQEISFTVPAGDLYRAIEHSRLIAPKVEAESVDYSVDVAKSRLLVLACGRIPASQTGCSIHWHAKASTS